MSKYKVDQLKKDKVYNETLLSLWSGKANYQDFLATVILIVGYDLREKFNSSLQLGQNSKESNKVIQLHNNNQSLVLWYTKGYVTSYIIPLLVTKAENGLEFSLYHHENKELVDYLSDLSIKDLYNAGESVFNNLVSLATSKPTPMLKFMESPEYTLSSAELPRYLDFIIDDYSTTVIALALTDTYELLKSDSNKSIYLSIKDKGVDAHYLPEINYAENRTPKDEYKGFIFSNIKKFNDRYSDGTRIILSKHFEEVEVYDDMGLCYHVPILEEDSGYSPYNDLGFIIPLVEHANELYSRLGDLNGAKFTSSELLNDVVKLSFEKTTDWRFNKKITGALYFSFSFSLYAFTFQTDLQGDSVNLQLEEGEVLTLPFQPIRFSKTIDSYETEVVRDFKKGMDYMETVTLKDLLRDNNLLADTDKGWMG